MARADSAAVVENTVIATCSLISIMCGEYTETDKFGKQSFTEWSRVHESPKRCVWRTKTVIEWPRDNFLQNDT